MPEVLEQPATIVPKKDTRFTSANARAMAALSAERRRAVPFKFPAIVLPTPPEPVQAVDPRLELLAEQITLTRDALNRRDLEPKDRAQLVRALCGLLDQQRIARGEPLPGSRRPRPDAKPAPGPRLADIQPEPVPATDREQATPQPVVPPVPGN